MKLSLIAAIGKNNELGKNNDLIWHLPGDLKFFKETTMNKTVIMGYNTYLSLPRKLPNRKYIVLSLEDKNLGEDIEVYNDINILKEALQQKEEEMFIIGGASMYKQFLDDCENLYLTEIDAESEADVYFPLFDKTKYTREIIGENEDNNIKYKHIIYRRK